MASRISQMRNGTMHQPSQQQQSLNESIERTREIMQQMKGMSNPEQAIMQLLQSNPQLGQLSTLLRNGNSLEGIARGMAQASGLDINTIIQGLGGK